MSKDKNITARGLSMRLRFGRAGKTPLKVVEKKQQLIFIVSIFLAMIIIAWVMTLGWSLTTNTSEDDDGSVKSMISSLERSIESFNDDIADKKINVNEVVLSLKKKFAVQQESINNITELMIKKLDANKIESWNEYNEGIYFKYPADWQLTTNENIIKLELVGEQIISITIYSNVSDLPDNINNLDLVVWLDEQVDRDLGVFSGYELSDIEAIYDIYNVMRKDDKDIVDMYWQVDDLVYNFSYGFDKQYDRIIKLIISTIK